MGRAPLKLFPLTFKFSDMKTYVKDLEENLTRFQGSEVMYSIPWLETYYTEGIKYLARTAECYWLISDVSIVGKSLMAKSYFVTIDFKRLAEEEQKNRGYEGMITYSDGNGKIFKSQAYELTDFPLNYLRLFFVDNTLMLPTEY